jgi:hypothetical protein
MPGQDSQNQPSIRTNVWNMGYNIWNMGYNMECIYRLLQIIQYTVTHLSTFKNKKHQKTYHTMHQLP